MRWAVPPRLAVGSALIVLSAVPPAGASDLGPRHEPRTVEAFVEWNCLGCHDAILEEGGLNLEGLPLEPDDPDVFDAWVEVFDKVRDGAMPPEDAEAPPEEERAAFLADLERLLAEADGRRQAERGRGLVRRLNREEFETTLEDLFGRPFRIAEMLPPDARGHGFDPVRNAPLADLFVSMLQRLGVEADRFASGTGTLRGLEMA